MQDKPSAKTNYYPSLDSTYSQAMVNNKTNPANGNRLCNAEQEGNSPNATSSK
jgi:hypothetical protein